MSSRRLSDAERTLWRKVQENTTPLKGKEKALISVPKRSPLSTTVDKALHTPVRERASNSATQFKTEPHASGRGLDGSWDRKLAHGSVVPDITIDLHGMTLDHAWQRLMSTLRDAIAMKARTILVITGKDRGGDTRMDPCARGRIRAKVTDWIDTSPYSHNVISLRPAARRHGGEGAIYIILRRYRR